MADGCRLLAAKSRDCTGLSLEDKNSSWPQWHMIICFVTSWCVLSSTLWKPIVLHRIVQSKQKTWNYQVDHFLSSFSESVTFLCVIWIKVINNSIDLPHRTSLWHFIGLIWRVGAIPANTAVQSKCRNCTERLLVSGMSSSNYLNYTFWERIAWRESLYSISRVSILWNSRSFYVVWKRDRDRQLDKKDCVTKCMWERGRFCCSRGGRGWRKKSTLFFTLAKAWC